MSHISKAKKIISSQSSSDQFWLWSLNVIVLIALLLRLLLINQSFWLDEAAQAIESSRSLSQQLDIAKDFQPPLFHLWLHLFTYLSHAEWWLRLASLIPGLVTILFSMLIAQKLINRKTSYITGILLTTSQFHLFYSQELRPYAFAAMWGVISMYALLHLIHAQKKACPMYVVANLAGLLSTYVYPFLIPAQILITYLYKKSKLKVQLLHLCITGVFYLLWLPFLLEQLTIGMQLKAALPGWDAVVSLPLLKAIPLTYAKLILGRIELGMDVETLMLILLILPASVYFIYQARVQKYFKLLSIWLIVPVLLAWLVSFFIPVLEPKRVLYIQPAWYLLVAIGFVTKPSKKLLGILLAGQVLSIAVYLGQPINQREPWREAIHQIEITSQPNSGVIFAFEEPFAPWVWYQQQDLPTYTFPQIGQLTQQQLDASLTPALSHQHLYVFEYLMDLTDSDRKINQWLEIHGYSESGFHQYPNMGKIWIFSQTNAFAQP